MEKHAFVILSTQRSGSTLLRLYLDQIKQIRAHDELFISQADGMDFFYSELHRSWLGRQYAPLVKGGRIIRGPLSGFLIRRYLKRLFSSSPKFGPPHPTGVTGVDIFSDSPPLTSCEAKAVGFKLMYNQLALFPEIERWLSDRPIGIVHLVRSHILDIVVSRKLAAARSLYHATDLSAISPIRPIELEPEKTLSEITGILDAQSRHHDRYCVKEGYLISSFERLSDSPLDEIGRICDLLGCNRPANIPEAPLKKVVNRPLHEVVRNYGAIIQVMKAAGFEKHPLTNLPMWADEA